MAVTARRAVNFLTSQQAADLCSVDRRTLLRWIDKGLLNSHRPGAGRHRILRSDLRQFMRDHAMPIPRELLDPPRVAIVDDEEQIVKALTRVVTDHLAEVEVRTASDGFVAGVLVGSFRPHLLFLDIVMPGLSGVEVCCKVCSEPDFAATAIVVISGNLTDSLESELLGIGAKRCLAKPFNRDQITAVLDSTLPKGVRV